VETIPIYEEIFETSIKEVLDWAEQNFSSFQQQNILIRSKMPNKNYEIIEVKAFSILHFWNI
jgi:hypothetical protein